LIISVEEVSRLLAQSSQDRSTITRTSQTSDRDIQSRQAARIDVSTAAQDIIKVKNQLNQLPDVREERVAALKAQIANGTYHVSGEDIADLMIRRTLADNTAL